MATICTCMHFDDIHTCTMNIVALSPFLLTAKNARTKSNELRKQGNKLFKQNKYREAVEKYTSAAEACSGHDLHEEKTKVLCKSSLSHLKLREPWQALEYAEQAVRLNPNSDKVCLLKILSVFIAGSFSKVTHAAKYG